MKKILIAVLVIILMCIPAEAEFEKETDELLGLTGDMSEFAVNSANGDFQAQSIFSYIWDILLKEFNNIRVNLPPLFTLAILFSLKNCIKLEKNIDSLVEFSCICCVIYLTSGMIKDIFKCGEETCEALGVFVMTAVPGLCGVVAASGMPISASKGAFIILGASNILSFLINKIFFPVIYISYIFTVSSLMVENDIFSAIKKTVLTVIKTVLPWLVGIFTTVLAVFMKSSGKADDLILKSARLAIGNIVPFLGNALSDSATVVVSSVGKIKSQLGIIGIFGILSILLLPIIKMLCTIFVFKLLNILCCFLLDKKAEKYYEEISALISVEAGMTGTMAVTVLIGIFVLMG